MYWELAVLVIVVVCHKDVQAHCPVLSDVEIKEID
jgi:hypothetical protein